jgi:rare lipoprotein A
LCGGILCRDAAAAGRRPVAHVQHGLASYYAAQFQGDETASGRPFDHRAMVGAHRTLPLGTVVRVTNVQNGRSVRIRIIDRGPYGTNRRKGTIVDLSRAAARRLRMVHDGLVPVRLQVVRLPSAATAASGYNGRR